MFMPKRVKIFPYFYLKSFLKQFQRNPAPVVLLKTPVFKIARVLLEIIKILIASPLSGIYIPFPDCKIVVHKH